MRTKETRKWVDKMEKAARSAEAVAGNGASKKRKLSTTEGTPNVKIEESIGTAGPEENTNLPRSVNMSIARGASDAGPSREASPTFPYKPLNNGKLEIRVVILKPGDKSFPIECSLQHVATGKGSRHSYKALSYTWGSPEFQKTIMLDGIQVQVRENLWQALFHLRKEDFPIRLWIDAICINQEDIPERNQQVARMGTLYSLAEEVVVWLGPEENGSKEAFEFIGECMTCKARSLPADFASNLSSTPALPGLRSLTARAYWGRSWIIQEVFRARKVSIQCGFERLPWTQLGRFFRFVERQLEVDGGSQDPNLIFFRGSLPARLTKHRTAQELDLETLLNTYRCSLCTDPRDKIYSLLGLAGRRISFGARKKSRPQWITVDYSKSSQELFESMALLFYNDGGLPGSETSHFARLGSSYLGSQQLFYLYKDSHYYQVQRMQRLQEILGLKALSWGDWHWQIRSSTATDKKLCCPTVYNLVVSKTGPPWANGVNQDKIMDWYMLLCSGPDMPSPDSLKSALESLEDDDKTRLQMARWHVDGIERHSNVKEPPDIRPFTTYNGHTTRLGLTACDICPGDHVFRFVGCDVALVATILPLTIKGRAFVLQSNTGLNRGPDLSTADAAAFRYATPDFLDNIHTDMDNEEPSTSKYRDLPTAATVTNVTLTLGDWQSLTW